MKKAYYPYLILLITLAILSVIYYDGVLTKGPMSIHIWRQTDCLSIAHHYKEGASFLEPEMHILNADHHTSGKTAGEFPILYYVVGKIWQFTGEQYWVYRLIGLVLVIGSLFALFSSLKKILQNNFWAFCLSVLLFTSPIFAVYGVSFLTNVPAFCLIIFGLYNLHRYVLKEKDRYLYFAFALFALGGLMKISTLIPFVFIVLVLSAESLGWKSLGTRSLFKNLKKAWIGVAGVILSLGLWYQYAAHYNELHGFKYTFNNIYPIWLFGVDEFLSVWQEMLEGTTYSFFSRPMIFLLLIGLIVNLILWKRMAPLAKASTVLIPLGCIFYFILWAPLFGVHDYYYIDLLWLYPGILFPLAHTLLTHYRKPGTSIAGKVILVLFLSYNVLYSINVVKLRSTATTDPMGLVSGEKFVGQMCYLNKFDHQYWQNFVFIQPYLRELGIQPDDKVISVPDPSDCASLYLMGMHGWTNYSLGNTEEEFRKHIGYGAKYLIISNDEAFVRPEMQAFLSDSVGFFNGFRIFRLQ